MVRLGLGTRVRVELSDRVPIAATKAVLIADELLHVLSQGLGYRVGNPTKAMPTPTNLYPLFWMKSRVRVRIGLGLGFGFRVGLGLPTWR